MKLVAFITAGSLIAGIAASSAPIPSRGNFALSCQGNLIPLPFPLDPGDEDPVQHRACHAVCCKRKDFGKPKAPTA